MGVVTASRCCYRALEGGPVPVTWCSVHVVFHRGFPPWTWCNRRCPRAGLGRKKGEVKTPATVVVERGSARGEGGRWLCTGVSRVSHSPFPARVAFPLVATQT